MSGIRLAVVGGGNMAQAILTGALETGVLAPAEVMVADPDPTRRGLFEALGVATFDRATGFAGRLGTSTQIMLAVKPQYLAEAAADLAGSASGRVVISILAGSTSERIRQALGGSARVVRVMPNLPARIRKGMAAISLGEGSEEGDAELAETLFARIGDVVRIDESMMDAFTALAGSGPAYVFYLAEAMRDAGVAMGFDAATALRITRGTIGGAAALLNESQDDPSELRAGVTSRKGTTDAALTVLQQEGLAPSMVKAILAARDRGAELAKL